MFKLYNLRNHCTDKNPYDKSVCKSYDVTAMYKSLTDLIAMEMTVEYDLMPVDAVAHTPHHT